MNPPRRSERRHALLRAPSLRLHVPPMTPPAPTTCWDLSLGKNRPISAPNFGVNSQHVVVEGAANAVTARD